MEDDRWWGTLQNGGSCAALLMARYGVSMIFYMRERVLWPFRIFDMW